nr:EOG090X07KM [Eulimnadia texana]
MTVAAFEMLVILQRKLRGRWRNLEGQVVLVTGASSGLGESIAEAFYAQGCRLILCSRRESELARVRQKLLQSELRKDNIYPPVILTMDLEDHDRLEEAARAAVKIYGRIDVLINNAGVSYRGAIADTYLKVDERIMNVNYFGTVLLTKEILLSMIEKKSGQIVMIGSIQSKLSIPNRSAYAASKHALLAFTDSLRAEVAKNKIVVTSILPGYVQTNLSVNALTAAGSQYGVMDETTKSGMLPADVAKRVVVAVKTRKQEILVCPLLYKFVIVLRALFPSLYFYIMKHRAAKESKQKLH